MATYNGAEYIQAQLDSILTQLGAEDEVIITDDCSTDNTVSILRAMGDARVRLYVNGEQRGVTANFYGALQKAKGDYIFLSDQDDIWLPDKVKRNLELLQEYDLVVSDAEVTDASLHPIAPSLFALIGSREGLWKNWLACSFYGSCMAFRREVLLAAMPFPQAVYIAHDWWIGMVAECMYRVVFVNELLQLYRRHNDTVTRINQGYFLTRSQRPFRVKIAARWQMAWNLVQHMLMFKKNEKNTTYQ